MESDAGGGGGGKSPFRQRDTAHVATNALKSTQIEGIYDVVESAFDPSGPPCPSGADSSIFGVRSSTNDGKAFSYMTLGTP